MNTGGPRIPVALTAAVLTACAVATPRSARSEVIELASLNPSQGVVINRNADDVLAGYAVARAGDVNADGIDDFTIGAPFENFAGSLDAGAVYLVFGSTSLGASGSINLDLLDGVAGVRIGGDDDGPYRAGLSISPAGDVNGDGFSDLLIGAPENVPTPSIAGYTYVLYGGPHMNASPLLRLGDVDGQNGFVLQGRVLNEAAGYVVTRLGDLNGDGIDDIAIGAPAANVGNQIAAGVVYIVFGGHSLRYLISPDGVIALALLNGNNGFVIRGVSANENTGFSLAGLGDLDADGKPELLIGSPNSSAPGASFAGAAYIIRGSAPRAPGGIINLATLTPQQGVVIRGGRPLERFGYSVADAGDVNGDGRTDLLFGAPNATPAGTRSGQACVLFGAADLLDMQTRDLANLDPEHGFFINGAAGDTPGDIGDGAGFRVDGAADFNADGVDDLLVSAPWTNGADVNTGTVYILHGGPALGASGVIDLATLSPEDATIIRGIAVNDVSGRAAAFAGDVNDDGAPDVVIGAPGANRGVYRDCGESYIVFGEIALPADVDRSGSVGSHDLALLLSLWGGGDRRADFNRDAVVNAHDLQWLLGSWGQAR